MDKATEKKSISPEITSLSSTHAFDADSLDIEELERRFEMTLFAEPVVECSCPNLTSCGTYCNQDQVSK